MGTRQLRILSPTTAALEPLVTQAVQVVLPDGTVRHGTLLALSPTALQLQLNPRLPALTIPLTGVREVIADADSNH